MGNRQGCKDLRHRRFIQRNRAALQTRHHSSIESRQSTTTCTSGRSLGFYGLGPLFCSGSIRVLVESSPLTLQASPQYWARPPCCPSALFQVALGARLWLARLSPGFWPSLPPLFNQERWRSVVAGPSLPRCFALLAALLPSIKWRWALGCGLPGYLVSPL